MDGYRVKNSNYLGQLTEVGIIPGSHVIDFMMWNHGMIHTQVMGI